ncbi:MAG: hypothetical protein K0V04_28990 [Deltaproteobacteria bacterium]|nr:hypothetical protein [Deltaproteobacteria bacterium]
MLAPVAAAHALSVLLAAQRLGLGFDGRVQVTVPPTMAPGDAGELSMTILDTPAPRMPLMVRLSSTAVGLPETRLAMRDVVDPLAQQPRIRARFVAPAQPGRYSVEGLVEYVTCDAERCRPRRTTVVWAVVVEQPTEVVP